MPATEVSPSACRLCGEIHRSIAAHLRRAHGLDVASSEAAEEYVLHDWDVPWVEVESVWTHEHSTAASLGDLRVSVLTNGDIVFLQKVNRPLFESRRTGNLKRAFKFRTDLQYVWYDDIIRLPMFYALSTLKYQAAEIEVSRRTQLLPPDGADLGPAGRKQLMGAFDRIVIRPRRIRVKRRTIKEISTSLYTAFPYSQFASAFSVVPSALVQVEGRTLYLLNTDESRLADLDASRVIREARNTLAPYPLLLTTRNALCLNGAPVTYDGKEQLREGLLNLSETTRRRRLSVPTIAA